MHVLIVEDEIRLAEALGQIMSEQRYLSDLTYNGPDGLEYGLTGQYDVIVLDWMLPGMDGAEVARQLREARVSTPILMLTARDELGDKVHGLDCGADDYMTKPFAAEELLARIRALSRRQGEVQAQALTYADLTLNLSTRCLQCHSREVRLGFKEFEVLKLLIAYPKMVVPKEEIILKVWGAESDAEDNNVEVYVSFLRKKLQFLESRVTIRTVRKVGYFLEVEDRD